MKLSHVVSHLILLLVSFPAVMMAQSQSWTDNTGKFSVSAEFLRFENGVVWLRKVDGKEISVPIDRLSADSLVQARQISARIRMKEANADRQGPLHIQHTKRSIFSPDSKGNCPSEQDVILFCDDRLCLVWQKTERFAVPDDKARILKSLAILWSYIDFASMVMDYKPLPMQSSTVVGSDGKKRTYMIELVDELCPGYGGAGHNGHSWVAVPKERFVQLYKTAYDKKPTVHQVFFYELGRNTYDLKLDNILDWQLDDESKHGFWTLGFNGAMTVLAPEALGMNMEYYGMNTEVFRAQRIRDIKTYIDNPKYNFDNTWCVYLLPWASGPENRQSVNEMMSGMLIMLSDEMGGIEFLSQLFRHLKDQPITSNKTDRKERATNLYRAAQAAAASLQLPPEKIDNFFKDTLRWDFLD